jgi:hypothetical protein
VGLVSEQYTKVPLAQAVFTKVVAVKTASAHAVYFTLNLMLFFPFKGDRKLAANLFCEKSASRLAAILYHSPKLLLTRKPCKA